MKKIHLLPTDKPSRLVRNGKELLLVEIPKSYTFYGNVASVNIYITSDEEIEEGNWGLSKLNEVILFGRSYNEKFYKKIILTTDQYLIKYGVQSIPDEFLEWFVKNPSCEEVKVNKSYGGTYYIEYPFVIPKEEPTLANMKCICMRFEANCFSGMCINCGFPPKEQQSTKDRILSETPDEVKQRVTDKADLLVNKKETLEEAKERYLDSPTPHSYRLAVEFGAKWQQEKSYSELELFINEVKDKIDLFEHSVNQKSYISEYLDEWFEKFKKK